MTATIRAHAGILSARRRLLGFGAGFSGMAVAGPLLAQVTPLAPPAAAAGPAAAPRAKGPLVWLDLDQAELDAAYDQSKYAPNIQQVLKRYASNSESARSKLGAPRRQAYGPSPIEGLDIFATPKPNAPIAVFIHGGAWRAGMAKDYAFPAELFVRNGAHLVVPDFVNVLESGGDLQPMAAQVRRALAWTYRNAASFGGDPGRLYVCGHSSGGHLAGVALTTDWKSDFDLPADIIKGGLCCSGLFDLKAPRLSARSAYVKFTDDGEQALSPQRHLGLLNAPVVLVHGTLETPEFQRQTRDFAAAVKAAGKPAQLVVADGYNHFEIAETLAQPYGACGRAMLELMKLTAT